MGPNSGLRSRGIRWAAALLTWRGPKWSEDWNVFDVNFGMSDEGIRVGGADCRIFNCSSQWVDVPCASRESQLLTQTFRGPGVCPCLKKPERNSQTAPWGLEPCPELLTQHGSATRLQTFELKHRNTGNSCPHDFLQESATQTM